MASCAQVLHLCAKLPWWINRAASVPWGVALPCVVVVALCHTASEQYEDVVFGRAVFGRALVRMSKGLCGVAARCYGAIMLAHAVCNKQ